MSDPNVMRPRQVRLLKCAILSPGLEQRAKTPADASILKNYGYDIMPYVQRIDIYESIFNNTLSGSVLLLENVGLVEYLPIVGVEILGIKFSVDVDGDPRTFQRSFRISKVSDVTWPRHEWRLYRLSLVTNEFLISTSKRICRAYNGVTAAQAARDIMVKDLEIAPDQIDEIEETAEPVNVLIPNYTPLKAINYLTLLARTKDTKESNFLFYETLYQKDAETVGIDTFLKELGVKGMNGGFHFTSISKLISYGKLLAKSTPLTPSRVPTFFVNSGQIGADNAERNSIIRIQQDQAFDLLYDIAGGTLRSKLVHFDFLARTVEKQKDVKDSRYTETFEKTTHLEDGMFYPKNFDLGIGKDVRMFMIPSNAFSSKSKYTAKNGGDTTEQQLRESVMLRNRQMREIQHIQTLIELPGQPYLRAGAVVNVQYPSSRVLQESTPYDTIPEKSTGTPFHSGLHLVTSVHHILQTQGESMLYTMNIRVNKDSLAGKLIGSTSDKGK